MVVKLFCSHWPHKKIFIQRRLALWMQNSSCNVKGKKCWAVKPRTYFMKSLNLPAAEAQGLYYCGNDGWSLPNVFIRILSSWWQSFLFEEESTKANSGLLVNCRKSHAHNLSCFSQCTLKYFLGFTLKHALDRNTVNLFYYNNLLSRLWTSQLKIWYSQILGSMYSLQIEIY